jgi:sigma-54-specific transcriptional regulator
VTAFAFTFPPSSALAPLPSPRLSTNDRFNMSETQAHLLAFPNLKAPVLPDPRSEQIAGQLQRLAPTQASVLIIGETGTGKELAARFLHEHSHRPGPFVAVNCASFSESLVEAELFGHEAGAFTGAQQARAGWFEAAHTGTLFLDEIGDMPVYLQAKLLRVLQERQVVRLGSRKSSTVDVRVIAATNTDLEAAVDARQFRRDLYYRLNVASVRLPPLRERRQDILPLAQHFIELYRRKLGSHALTATAATEQALLAYDWPGNIRELENVIHRGTILCRDGWLHPEDLRLPVATARPEAVVAKTGVAPALESVAGSLHGLLRSDLVDIYGCVERLLMTTAFEHCDGNQLRTARRLGISRNMVRRQLKRYGLLSTEV